MKYNFALLAAAAVVNASPLPAPQAVTALISPSSPAPSGCMPNFSGSFGIVAMNVTAASGSATISQKSDGQPQASSGPAPVSTISDGQPQAPTGSAAPITTISDGQPQAPTGAPKPAPISQISDGQPQQPTMMMMPPISQISDGQIQAPTMTAVSQISDGQIQAPHATPISQISDGQPQAPKPTAAPITTISDGQPQAPKPTASPVTTISDGQPQAPKPTASPVSTISDGQPQAPKPSASPVSTISDGQPQAPTGSKSSAAPMATMSAPMQACNGPDVLSITLEGGVLKDNKGRTGYIAANYQFQFDGPPQAGAIYTSGWTVCGNGSLALGSQTTFYQCLSGDFYNLYSENWAPQCNAVTIDVLSLINCS